MTSDRIQIRVYGEPEAAAKKEVAVNRKAGQLIPIDRDFRTRKNPITSKIEKYDKGYKRRWMNLVADTVRRFMQERNLEPFGKNHPVALGLLFFLTKADSSYLPYPSQKPDYNNLVDAVYNALKRTPAKNGHEGKYPNGILFYDDDQIVWTSAAPSGMLWADDKYPPGVLITVQSAMSLQAEISRQVMELCPK